MERAFNIDTSNKINTQEYSTRGGRPITYSAQKQVQAKSGANLRKGEIVFGEILKKLSKDIFKIKLPNGVYSAEIHPKLKQGDKLYFEIQSTKPNLIINVHSSNLILENNKLLLDEMLRVFNFPSDEVVKNLIIDYAKRAKRLFKETIEAAYYQLKESDLFNLSDNLILSPEQIILDLYFSGFNINDSDCLNLFPNYLKPGIVKDIFGKSHIIPDNNNINEKYKFNSEFEKALYIRNVAADVNNSQKIYYVNEGNVIIRLEYLQISDNIKKLLIQKTDRSKILLSIDEANKYISIGYIDEKPELEDDINEIYDGFKLEYFQSNQLFIAASPEHLDVFHRKLTFVI